MLKLAPLLMRHGLTVTVGRDGIVTVRNPRGSAATDPLGRALNPGMKQDIVLRAREGTWWWHWIWSGPAQDAPPELEPMVPARAPDEAARRLANVLAVRP